MNPLAVVAKAVFGEYEIYRIYGRALSPGDGAVPAPDGIRLDPLVDGPEMDRADDPAIRRLASCAGAGAHGFGAWADGTLVAVCWFWVGERYAKRNFWPLAEGEAKLVEIMSASALRGRGIAGALLRYSCRGMASRGYRTAYARVWHSNAPSIRLFLADGWTHVATVAHLHPFGRKRPVRIVRRVRDARHRPILAG